VPARPLSESQIARIREMRADGHTQEATAAAVGCHPFTVRKYAPGYPGKVPNDRLREAFLASGRSPADVARVIGWRGTNGTPNGGRVRQTLGLNADGSRGRRRYRRLIDWETGSLIAEAIGVMPWEVLEDGCGSDLA
jgi:hypothetical protein